MDPLTVQEEMMFSCCLMAVSLVNVALVRFLKNGNPMQEVLAAPLLVLLEGGMAGSVGLPWRVILAKNQVSLVAGVVPYLA